MSKDRTTEMLNYLSAISREVGEMRAEINSRLVKVETDIKEIKYELHLMREDFRRSRVEVLESN